MRQGFQHLTQENLDRFRQQIGMPDDQKLHALTIDELIAYSRTKQADGSDATDAPENQLRDRFPPTRFQPTPCQAKTASVLIDAIVIAFGMVGIGSKQLGKAVDETAKLIDQSHGIDRDIMRVVRYIEKGSLKDRGWAVYRLARLIIKAGMAVAIWNAIVKNLTWYDMVLYGVEGVAEVAAFLATDGASEVPLILGVLARTAFFVTDAVEAVEACGDAPVDPNYRDLSVALEQTVGSTTLFIGPLNAGPPPKPGMSGEASAVTLKLVSTDRSHPITDGDVVTIQTTEAAAGDTNLISYEGAGNITYAKAGALDNQFTLRHYDRTLGGARIQDGDLIDVICTKMPNRHLLGDSHSLSAGAVPANMVESVAMTRMWVVHMKD